MKIIIVRHAESESNITEIIRSRSIKVDLTDIGREQANKLANSLVNQKIDYAFISPLDRAKQTAEIILRKHSETQIDYSDELKEKHVGIFEGRKKSELREAWQQSGLLFGEFQPEDGENWHQAGKRTVNLIKEIINQHKNSNQTILIVSHGSVVTYSLMWADGFNIIECDKEKYDYYHPSNTAMSVIEVNRDGETKLTVLNDTSHLEK